MSAADRGEGVATYIAMAPEMLEQLNLSQSTLSEDLLAENVGDLLDGDALASLAVGRGTGISQFPSSAHSPRKPQYASFAEASREHTRQYHKHPGPVPW